MKTKFYFLVISFLAICSVCLPACDNDEKGDVTKPVIDLIEPEEGAVLKIGNGKGKEQSITTMAAIPNIRNIFLYLLFTSLCIYDTIVRKSPHGNDAYIQTKRSSQQPRTQNTTMVRQSTN